MKNKPSRNDLTSGECQRFRKLESAFLSRCRHFGYNEIKTSTIQPLHIFTALGAFGDKKIKRIYSFMDWNGWSGERVALKPDSTTSVVRFYGEAHGDALAKKQPADKFCYVENHFEWADSADTDSETDKISERWQCGIENIGDGRPTADIEVIYAACDILRKVGVPEANLFLSYPRIVRELIDTFTLDQNAKNALVTAIRKKDEDLSRHVTTTEDAESLERLLTLQGRSTSYLKNLLVTMQGPKYETVAGLLNKFVAICELLDGLEQKYTIDFTLLGDFEYYTGIQFQVLAAPVRKSKSDILCAGGRYDNLIGNMWDLTEPVPAVGFGIYGRNTIRRIPDTGDKRQNIALFIKNVNRGNVETGQKLCDKLARLGFAPGITFAAVPVEAYDSYGLVIEVNHEEFEDGFRVDFSQKVGKPLLIKLFGELNDR